MNFIAANAESEAGPANVEDVNPSSSQAVDEAVFCGDCVPTGGFSVAERDEDEDSVNDIAPVDRIVFPLDIVNISPTDETLQIVGTRGEKVTRLGKLESVPNLKVFILISAIFYLTRDVIVYFFLVFNC